MRANHEVRLWQVQYINSSKENLSNPYYEGILARHVWQTSDDGTPGRSQTEAPGFLDSNSFILRNQLLWRIGYTQKSGHNLADFLFLNNFYKFMHYDNTKKGQSMHIKGVTRTPTPG